jgi:hypothetical protein
MRVGRRMIPRGGCGMRWKTGPGRGVRIRRRSARWVRGVVIEHVDDSAGRCSVSIGMFSLALSWIPPIMSVVGSLFRVR